MNDSEAVPIWRRWLLVGTVAVVTTGTLVLFLFDPSHYRIYPICFLHQFTGWSCPGCGGLRAMHQLTHGNFAAAWALNPLAVALLPVALWLGARELAWQWFGRPWPGMVTKPVFGWTLVAVTILFGILRNVPGFSLW